MKRPLPGGGPVGAGGAGAVLAAASDETSSPAESSQNSILRIISLVSPSDNET